MPIAEDVISRLARLGEKRSYFESTWRDIHKLMYPQSSGGMFDRVVGTNVSGVPGITVPASSRMPTIVDATGMWSLDRLGAGIESLVSPVNTKWHTVGFNDPMAVEPNDHDQRWFDRQRDFLFSMRYNPRSGFRRANQMAIRATCAFGHGDIFVEEWFGEQGVRLPYRYVYIPTSESFIDKDVYGEVDTHYRSYMWSARQAANYFGLNELPPKLQAAAQNPNEKDKLFTFIHAVEVRKEGGSTLAGSVKSSRFASYYVSVEEKTLIRDSGYYEFPYIHYEWSSVPGSPYSESPAMLALADVKTSQVIAGMELRASQQFIDPPLALPPKGQLGRINLNSRALNYGALTSRGDLLVRPIITAQAPTFAQAILEARRNNTRETLYLNLFQYLMTNPSMTATEALLRDQERAMILGPAGSKLQEAQGFLVERELAILGRRGFYDSGGPLEAPPGSRGRDFGAKFTSPLDRLMGSAELTGLLRLYELAGAMAQTDPNVLHNLSGDESIRKARELLGAPAVALVPYEVVLQRREAEAQAQQAAAAIGTAKAAGEAANEVIPAMEQANALASKSGTIAGPRQSARSAGRPGPRRRV